MEYHLGFGIPALLVGLILLWRKSGAYDALIALLANPLKRTPRETESCERWNFISHSPGKYCLVNQMSFNLFQRRRFSNEFLFFCLFGVLNCLFWMMIAKMLRACHHIIIIFFFYQRAIS